MAGLRRARFKILAVALTAGLVACSREPPPPLAAASADLGAAQSPGGALPPSAQSPAPAPIVVSPLIRVGTASPAAYEPFQFPVSIPGVLDVRAPNLDVQSHGVGSEPWTATFLVTNETMTPLSVKLSDVVYRSDDPSLVAGYPAAQKMVVVRGRAENVPVSVERGVVVFTAPPRRKIEIDLDLDPRQTVHVAYHVSYHHDAVFTVGDAHVTGHGYQMYFRYPLR